jgi:AraC-like DNA-binding protein
MKPSTTPHRQFSSITAAHEALGLPKPLHPLISLVNGCASHMEVSGLSGPHVLQFYKISYKLELSGKLRYGQHYYDFDGGGLLFASPGQIIGGSEDVGQELAARSLLIHPDFLLGHPLAAKIKQFGFFSYAVHEALHLSDEEKETILSIFGMIERELKSRIDDFSQDVIISQIELLLNFANRFYKRQFITRKAVNNELLEKMEALLAGYFTSEDLLRQGVPTVAYLAGQLNLSPSYLSDMLRALTGQNAQQHIHFKLIEKAKELLSTTNLSVSEVAYALGFEYSQSFSKLFKQKTRVSPLEFREQFN